MKTEPLTYFGRAVPTVLREFPRILAVRLFFRAKYPRCDNEKKKSKVFRYWSIREWWTREESYQRSMPEKEAELWVPQQLKGQYNLLIIGFRKVDMIREMFSWYPLGRDLHIELEKRCKLENKGHEESLTRATTEQGAGDFEGLSTGFKCSSASLEIPSGPPGSAPMHVYTLFVLPRFFRLFHWWFRWRYARLMRHYAINTLKVRERRKLEKTADEVRLARAALYSEMWGSPAVLGTRFACRTRHRCTQLLINLLHFRNVWCFSFLDTETPCAGAFAPSRREEIEVSEESSAIGLRDAEALISSPAGFGVWRPSGRTAPLVFNETCLEKEAPSMTKGTALPNAADQKRSCRGSSGKVPHHTSGVNFSGDDLSFLEKDDLSSSELLKRHATWRWKRAEQAHREAKDHFPRVRAFAETLKTTTLIAYTKRKDFLEELQLPDWKRVYAAIVTREGKIVWFENEKCTVEKANNALRRFQLEHLQVPAHSLPSNRTVHTMLYGRAPEIARSYKNPTTPPLLGHVDSTALDPVAVTERNVQPQKICS